MENTSLSASGHLHVPDNYSFDAFVTRIQARLDLNSVGPLFTTDATDLYDAYLSGFEDPDVRQYHTCHACKAFIERVGGLVTIQRDGSIESAIWNTDDAPLMYKTSIDFLRRNVRRAKVNGVWLSSDQVWGKPVTGEWTHFALKNPILWKHRIQTDHQAMAEKHEDFLMLIRGLAEFRHSVVLQAVNILKSDALYRSEKVLGIAEWLLNLHEARANAKSAIVGQGSSRANNLVWHAVATAPPGFPHIRSTMIASLLDDLTAGLDLEDVKRKFAAKINPTQYQRPQAAPSVGNIAAAEKLVDQLGVRESLKRRFARLDELQTLWKPAEAAPAPPGGVFAHLIPKDTVPLGSQEIDSGPITWVKFLNTVLPDAEQIEYYVSGVANFIALVTAVNPEAPPILQWDEEEARNPVSWYVYPEGSSPANWNLRSGYVKVVAVTLQPSMWRVQLDHQGKGVIFILEGAKDIRYQGSGLALFPETLKTELRGIRSTIEAFSKAGDLEGFEEANACGVGLQATRKGNIKLRVLSRGTKTTYTIDRWD